MHRKSSELENAHLDATTYLDDCTVVKTCIARIELDVIVARNRGEFDLLRACRIDCSVFQLDLPNSLAYTDQPLTTNHDHGTSHAHTHTYLFNPAAIQLSQHRHDPTDNSESRHRLVRPLHRILEAGEAHAQHATPQDPWKTQPSRRGHCRYRQGKASTGDKAKSAPTLEKRTQANTHWALLLTASFCRLPTGRTPSYEESRRREST